MTSLQKFISNLKINKSFFSCYLKKNHNIKKKCPQYIKKFGKRSLKILYEYEEAVFKHMLMRYILKKKKCESFMVI